jgi:serine/threonine protein kinase
MNEVQTNYAKQECVIHSRLRHENVVELYHYTEDPDEYVLFMEYCNDANYLEQKIEGVISLSIIQLESQSDQELREASVIHLGYPPRHSVRPLTRNHPL